VAFTLVRPSTGTTWRIQQRYVNTGLDENVAARLWLNGTPTSLALVTDRQGGYIMGVKANGLEETSTGFYLRNAFGKMEIGRTAAISMETHTGLGFAGAGTPTSAGGGYVYMRNRWYDPQTGRFLSQDPIGLAGGVNLYAYAGNNPTSYSDPFGLDCPLRDWSCKIYRAGMTVLGAVTGFVAGGGKGALESLVCGPATEACGVVAVPVEAIGGAITGAAAGYALSDPATRPLKMAKAGKGRGSNQGPNDEARRIGKKYDLNAAGRRELHDRITGQGMAADEIEAEAADIANHEKWINNPKPPEP
jgi:RHS repeat-associated protein